MTVERHDPRPAVIGRLDAVARVHVRSVRRGACGQRLHRVVERRSDERDRPVDRRVVDPEIDVVDLDLAAADLHRFGDRAHPRHHATRSRPCRFGQALQVSINSRRAWRRSASTMRALAPRPAAMSAARPIATAGIHLHGLTPGGAFGHATEAVRVAREVRQQLGSAPPRQQARLRDLGIGQRLGRAQEAPGALTHELDIGVRGPHGPVVQHVLRCESMGDRLYFRQLLAGRDFARAIGSRSRWSTSCTSSATARRVTR